MTKADKEHLIFVLRKAFEYFEAQDIMKGLTHFCGPVWSPITTELEGAIETVRAEQPRGE